MTVTKSKPLQEFTDRVEFDSSVVHEAFYDAPSTRLFVVLQSGRVCGYENVSQSGWEAFVDADSAGRHWNRYIKGNGAFRKLSGDVDFVERARIDIDASAFTSVFNQSAFTPTELYVARDNTNVQAETPADRVFLVTVAVQAQNLGVAVNDVVSQGLEVVAVNPA